MLIALKGVLGLSRAELAGHDPALASELDAALEKRGQAIPKELVDAPLGTIPEVLAVLDSTRLDALLSLVPLSAAARRELLGLARPEALEPEVVRALVDKAIINATEAEALGQTLERYLFCEDDLGLVDAVGKATGRLSNAEVAAWTPNRWIKALSAVDARPPPGISLSVFAEQLARRFEGKASRYPVLTGA